MTFKASDIYPMRFLRRFPENSAIIRRAAQQMQSGLLSSEAFEKTADECVASYNCALGRLAFDERPDNSDVLTGIISTVVHTAAFVAGGRNIIVIPPAISVMLAQTDLGDIRLSDINLPFSAFYIAFSGGLGVGLPGPMNVIDGAYVEQFNRFSIVGESSSVSFYLTTRRTDRNGRGSAAWISEHEPHFFVPLEIGDGIHTLRDAVERAVARHDIAIKPNLDAIAALQHGVEDVRRHGFDIQSPEITGYERAAKYNRDALLTVQGILSLICNALCLLSSKPDLSIQAWPSDAPRSLIESADKANTPKRRRTAVGRLAEELYFPVRHLRLPIDGNSSSDASNKVSAQFVSETAPHWRRGHWRRQPFGPNLIERKLLWIRPVLVNKRRGEPARGHVYHAVE